MNVFFYLLYHEIRTLVISPATYLAAVLSLIMIGSFHFLTLVDLAQFDQSELPNVLFFRYFLFPVVLLVPMLTMRSIAEERRLGTLDTLKTTPVNSLAIVLSKFLAAYLFYCLLWLTSLLFPVISVYVLPQPDLSRLLLDTGSLVGGITFVGITGMLFVAVGIFTSSLTRSQLVAGMLSFSIIFLMIVGITALHILTPSIGDWHPLTQGTLSYLQVFEHYDDMVHGVIDTRPVVYYFSATTLVLGIATLAVEVRS